MALILNELNSIWIQLVSVVKTARFVDLLDIICVALILYKGIQVIRETRAEQLIKGILFFVILYIIALSLKLQAMMWLINAVTQYGIIAVLIVFQPELRRVLEQIGRSNIRKIGFGFTGEQGIEIWSTCLDAISAACVDMGKTKTGALIVIECKTMLGEIVKTGTIIDATATEALLCNLFFPNSPLHDGAVVIRMAKVYAAGCILPLTANNAISRELGTRHRAALGMSENSDAIVVVVSEETGNISITQDGKIERGLGASSLREALENAIFGQPEVEISGKKKRFWKFK